MRILMRGRGRASRNYMKPCHWKVELLKLSVWKRLKKAIWEPYIHYLQLCLQFYDRNKVKIDPHRLPEYVNIAFLTTVDKWFVTALFTDFFFYFFV